MNFAALHKVNKIVRTFVLSEVKTPLPNLRADLIAKGFDGTIWHGEAEAQGKRREHVACFYRVAATNEFQHAYSL